MAKPQVEDGHTKIANELLEALARFNFSAYEIRVFWVILRKTYGWGKKTDRISYSQFQEYTGIDRRHIGRAVSSLKSRCVITCTGKGYSLEYGVQKDYDLWDLTPKEATIIDTVSGNDLTPKEATNFNEKQENLTPFQGDLTPFQGKSLPLEVSKSLPLEATTKAIKHIQKHYTKERLILPDWINIETWNDFLEMRRKMKKIPTEHAKQLLIKDLERLKSEGNDPNKVLEESIKRNWTGVFPLKEQYGGQDGARKRVSSRNFTGPYTQPDDFYGRKTKPDTPPCPGESDT